MTSDTRKPRILITAGEPAGIGPDLLIMLSQLTHNYNLSVIGDPILLETRATELSLPIDIVCSDDPEEHTPSIKQNQINVLPIILDSPVKTGELDTRNSRYVLDTLNTACDYCLDGIFDAMVTTPLQKSIINDAGIEFSGHTEYLAKRCGEYLPVMLLSCPELRVALVTTHLPLKDVSELISKDRIETVLRTILNEMPIRFGINNPHITVCGLNPHAGENGHLGTEEQESIIPVINTLKSEGHRVEGPLPADTAFRKTQREITDVYLCMYHDQGLPVLKTLGFGEAVNITLGLPIIRTSVDHGTALELAGTGKADYSSLMAAIDMAETMAFNQANYHQDSSAFSSSHTVR